MDYRPFKIVFIYLLAAVAWIVITDRLMGFLPDNLPKSEILFWQTIKGVGFVVFTGTILYFLVKRDHESLVTSEKQYRELFTSNPNPMWVYNLNTYRFVEINQATIDKYGYTRDEFLNMTVLDIRPQEDRADVIEFIKKIKRREGTSGVWRHVEKSGEELIASIKSFPVVFNGQKCAMVLAVDVTEKINQQKQLEDSYKKEIELNEALAAHIELIKRSNEEKRTMGEIIEKVNNFVIITGADGIVRWVNKAYKQFTQMDNAHLIGQPAVNLFFGKTNDSETVASFINAIANKAYFSGEICNETQHGEEYWVHSDLSPIYNESGDLDCFIAVQTLITERKLREEKIQQQNQVLRQLAWVSSHELRKPISSIISLINILKETEDPHEQAECMKLLEECAAELDNLVKDVARKVNIAEGEQPLV